MAEAQAFEDIKKALAADGKRETKAAHIAEVIRGSRNYRWAGIYEIDGEEIAAIAWTGPDAPAFPRFPKAKGLCGAAVLAAKTIAVGDVAQDPRYLTTFGSTKSEIIVPIFVKEEKAPAGLIDVESEKFHAFQSADCAFLERCAELVTSLFQ